jgi:hypothetical protein
MKTAFTVIDNFYGNPWEVREQALQLEYKKLDGATYPGENSFGYLYNDEIHSMIEHSLATKLVYPKEMQCGYFRFSPKDADSKQDVHIDPDWDIGGVLYLNPPNQCEKDAGTSFYRHNILGSEQGAGNEQEAREMGFPTYKHFIDEMIYGDCLDRSKWTKYATIPFTFNRLVLFDSHLWHSHGHNFGSTVNDSRLVQLFFYKKDTNDKGLESPGSL